MEAEEKRTSAVRAGKWEMGEVEPAAVQMVSASCRMDLDWPEATL
jgi:hypothetical protein